MIIWCADANGQLGREEEAEGQDTSKDNDATNIVWALRKSDKTETGNGKRRKTYIESSGNITWHRWEMRTSETTQE